MSVELRIKVKPNGKFGFRIEDELRRHASALMDGSIFASYNPHNDNDARFTDDTMNLVPNRVASSTGEGHSLFPLQVSEVTRSLKFNLAQISLDRVEEIFEIPFGC